MYATPQEKAIPTLSRNLNDSNYSIHYISETILPDNVVERKGFNNYKVVFPKSGAWANWRSYRILEHAVIYCDTFIGTYFDTLNECDNFVTYFTTYFYRFCTTETATNWDAMRSIHRFVPNLTNVENPRTGLTGWDSDWTDEDLKVLLKDYLTEDDWEYIEKIALESDGGRK